MNLLAIVAGISALAHLVFASKEMSDWGRPFVESAAASWIGPEDTDAHIAWAAPLAFNMGSYNLLLALGLAVTAWAAAVKDPAARWLGPLFGVWLLGAAAAAGLTEVYVAMALQGVLGLLLLVVAMRWRPA
jgi:uncharacterized membrane protein